MDCLAWRGGRGRSESREGKGNCRHLMSFCVEKCLPAHSAVLSPKPVVVLSAVSRFFKLSARGKRDGSRPISSLKIFIFLLTFSFILSTKLFCFVGPCDCSLGCHKRETGALRNTHKGYLTGRTNCDKRSTFVL